MSAETTAPTRMNLIARRAQIKLAAEGVELLKGKREALLKELLERARKLRGMREELHRLARACETATAIAQAVDGSPGVRSAAVAGQRDLEVRIREAKTWGLPMLDVEAENIVRSQSERNIGRIDYSTHTQDAAEASERMVAQLLLCAPAEANLRLLGEELKKVTRRINALEEQLLPRLRADVQTISRVLEERQREDVFRLKRFKKRKSAAASTR